MFRYKDDVLSLNNCVDRIYSIEPEIKDTTDTDRSISYLDLHLEIDSEGRLWIVINQTWIVDDLLSNDYTLFNMLRWIQLHIVSTFVVLMYMCYLTVVCIPIQSHQSNQARSTTWRTSNGCYYSSLYSMLYLTMHMYTFSILSLSAA